jgi:hypothetical protein
MVKIVFLLKGDEVQGKIKCCTTRKLTKRAAIIMMMNIIGTKTWNRLKLKEIEGKL